MSLCLLVLRFFYSGPLSHWYSFCDQQTTAECHSWGAVIKHCSFPFGLFFSPNPFLPPLFFILSLSLSLSLYLPQNSLGEASCHIMRNALKKPMWWGTEAFCQQTLSELGISFASVKSSEVEPCWQHKHDLMRDSESESPSVVTPSFLILWKCVRECLFF